MPELQIEGTEKLHKVYQDLKRVGDVELKKALTKSIRDSTLPMKQAVKASALDKLPKRGGLAKLIANSRVTNKVKTGSQTAGVNIKASNMHEIASMNKGRLRHKVFGKGWAKKTQQVPAGWFTDPINEKAPEVQKAVIKALDDIARTFNEDGSRGGKFSI